MTSTGTSSTTSDRQKLLKFVELLVHDYLQARGFEDTGVKFAAECSKSLPVANDDHAESGTCKDESPVADEVDSWYYLANKLALPELLRHNTIAATGQRFAAVIEVLVQEMVQEKKTRSYESSTVSITSIRDAKGRRRQKPVSASTSDLTGAISAGVGKRARDVTIPSSRDREISAPAQSTGREGSPMAARVGQSTDLLRARGEECSSGHGAAGDEEKKGLKSRSSASPPRTIGRAWRFTVSSGAGTRQSSTRKHHASTPKRLHGYSPPSKGNRRSRDVGGLSSRFQFSKDAIRRHQMSHESWIPEDLRMKMMRRSMGVIKENVYQSLAQRTLVSKEKKRSSRSDLEIVKTQEKFGTKHQRPCGLCEQSFSEVNLILAVPFKAIVDLRIAWRKSVPQAEGSAAKANRTMLTPPQCYNEVKVCAFCSQLFHDPLGYRPTWDMEVSRRKKREALAREKEREYWDPLRKDVTPPNDQQPTGPKLIQADPVLELD